jgi:branched-chain amino acid transport system ATP-binding protein
MTMLKIRNLRSGYGNLGVLKGVSLHVNAGEIVTIIGGNGSGKSTLLRTVAGIVAAQEGEILFDGQEISRAAAEKIVAAGCSLVPEGRMIFNTMTVRENLVLGAYPRIRSASLKNMDEELAVIYGMFSRLLERGDSKAPGRGQYDTAGGAKRPGGPPHRGPRICHRNRTDSA